MVTRLEHSGDAPITSLTAPLAQGAVSFTVTDGAGYPDGAAGQFTVTIDRALAGVEETILCESRSSNTFTVASGGRGYSGTSDTAHEASATVEHTFTAKEADDINLALLALEAAWTDYSPTLRSYNTNAALGNGTVVARYRKVGRTVEFEWRLASGSTTTWGTGGGGVTGLLPFTPASGSLDFTGTSVTPGGSALPIVAVKAAGGTWWDLFVDSVAFGGAPGPTGRYRIAGTYEASA